MNSMNNISLNSDNNVAETVKKSWSEPAFEIISKDIVKGGTVAAGHEGTNATHYS
jgi:hypothetical protein